MSGWYLILANTSYAGINVSIVIILTKIINLIKIKNNFKKKLKIFGGIKNKTIFVPQ